MTELEAVNILLSVIGEAPIESFATTAENEVSDSALARRTLAEVKRDVLAEGWSWNTDERVPFAAAADGSRLMPRNALRVRFGRGNYPDGQYVMRGLKVWDRVNHTYVIDVTLEAEQVVYELPWAEMPHAAQQYVTIRAARIYASRFINSSVIFSYGVQDEANARAQLVRDEETREQNNMLWTHGPHGLGYVPSLGLRHRRN